MDGLKAPEIKKLQEITPDLFEQYVSFVATLRHNQNRWFRLRKTDALEISHRMEKELDDLNARLLDKTPKLFDIWKNINGIFFVGYLAINQWRYDIIVMFTMVRAKNIHYQNYIIRHVVIVAIMFYEYVVNVPGVVKDYKIWNH